MLRFLVLILLLANAAYFAWSQGQLAPLGWAPARQQEPGRLSQQIEPQRLRLLGAAEVKRNEAAAGEAKTANAPECLRAGLFDEAQSQALRQALASALPEGSWVLEPGQLPARWLIYMGRLTAPEALEKKKAELRARNVRFESVLGSALEPGLSLGSFATKPEADKALQALSERGVRTARVVAEREEQTGHWLRLPSATPALRGRVDELRQALWNKPLGPC
jgi:hypothetical protein